MKEMIINFGKQEISHFGFVVHIKEHIDENQQLNYDKTTLKTSREKHEQFL